MWYVAAINIMFFCFGKALFLFCLEVKSILNNESMVDAAKKRKQGSDYVPKPKRTLRQALTFATGQRKLSFYMLWPVDVRPTMTAAVI